MKKAKKQKINYKEDNDSKAAELEEYLFGVGGDAATIFEREKDAGADTVADLVKQATRRGGLLLDADLFFEDTAGGPAGELSSDEVPSDEESEGTDGAEDEEEGGPGNRRQRRGALPKGPAAGSHTDADADADADSHDGHEDKEEGDGGSDGEERSRSSGAGSDSDGDEDGEGDGDGGGADGDEDGDGGGGAAGGKARLRSSDGAGPTGRSADGASGGRASGPGRPGVRAPVWSDPNDNEVRVDVAGRARLRKLRKDERQTQMAGEEYVAALRKQHQALNPRTSWAKKRAAAADPSGGGGGDGDDDGAAALLTAAGGLTERAAGRRLPAGQIEVTRLKDANQHQPSDAVVQAVRFHPNGQLLLTAGLDKKLRLFQADGLRNPLVQAVHLDDLPITDAAFAAVGGGPDPAAADCVVLAGRRPFFYVYDMAAARLERVPGPAGAGLKSLERFAVSPPSSAAHSSEPLVAFVGDSGAIPLVSLRTRQGVGALKMSGNVRALAFSADGRELASTGDDGIVHIWDLRTRCCRLTFTDAGNVGAASSLALSPDGHWLATGAKSGVVNVYRRGEVEAAAAAARGAGGGGGGGRVTVAPVRELYNLTTDVDTLCFSPDSQMLALASRMKRDSLRLAHLPSLTVFANWPTSRTPLHYVHCLDFSPHCGLLAIGNAKGRAVMYRLHHYQQA